MSCGNVQDGPVGGEEEQAIMPRRKQIRRVDKTVCQRCKEAKSMYIIRNVTYCKSCFQAAILARLARTMHPPLKGYDVATSSRNAAALGGSRPARQKGDVVVGLSSGAGSTAMLDILVSRQYIGKGDGYVADKSKGEKDPVWDKGWVVYVEFAGVIEGAEERMEEVAQWVKEQAPDLGMIGLRAEDVYDGDIVNRIRALAGVSPVHLHTSAQEDLALDLKDPDLPLFPSSGDLSSATTHKDKLRALLASLPPPSRPALLSSILTSLLDLTARTLPRISHLLLGETSTRQAQRLIAGTALGRGWSLPLELACRRKTTEDITSLKPMKDMTTKEAAVYCHLKGFGTWTRNERRWDNAGPKGKRDARGKGGTGSLESLTEQFIAGLNVSHPATVSTIIRTGDKLVFPGEADSGPSCPVCQLPVEPSALEWKSRTGLTSLASKETSTEEPPQGPDPTVARGDPIVTLAPLLCYGCLTTFTSTTVVPRAVKGEAEPVRLPVWIEKAVSGRREVQREQMRSQIGDFLLDEEA
ncbi:hypothetical protein IAU60_002652 [Kwoniella sp. DSM 27419]